MTTLTTLSDLTTDRPDATEDGYERIEVRPTSGTIGAVIGGVSVGGDVEPATVAEIRRALLAHRVVFLRDQQHLDDAGQREFASLLGTPTKPHPTVAGDGDAVLPIDSDYSKANSWHTDVTFVDRVPAISLLRALVLPPYGGSTVWANTVRAYDTLHPALQALANELWAVHSNLYDYAAERDERRLGGIDVRQQEYRAEFGQEEFETEHPVVRVHPETGERSLLLGHFVRRFVGLSTRDSRELFELLQRHVTRLDNTVRWNWLPGDLVIWDNRATQHYAVDDYDDHPRLLHRITLAGDVPVSVDGERSAVRKGDASHYSEVPAVR
ncbi:TauD/TfdA dioxygenase family protein [Actinopolymorpha singaporensis]|uniref:Taurine dioxygenase n=1 Tax=Actinopolymorpha singaporensis TaxID=117157 RepID=A0A1H1V3P7_9ACTN|nr:TauD/TfdA family dioxygenase [Actinopolymorpha singaporensis]SDS79323.1 taurine dioxygenase [Actinopolymorpha singaporensis]